MSGLTKPSDNPDAPPVVSRGKIVMMAIIAGAVITNVYCIQPILPLIQAGLRVDVAAVDLVAGAALLGFATGLALLLPLGDRFDRRKLVLGQIALAFGFAVAAALAPGLWPLVIALSCLGAVACVPQQLVPFAAVMSLPSERGRSVGTVVSGIMVGILLGRTISGVGRRCLWLARGLRVGSGVMIPVWIAGGGAPAARRPQHQSFLLALARLTLAAGARPSSDS